MNNKKVHSKVVRKFQNSIGTKEWNREEWVKEVLRLASFKYNLEDSDFDYYSNYLKGKRRG